VPEIFMYSSNIGTVHMAMDAGTPAQQAFLRSLGLLQPAGVELGEVFFFFNDSATTEIYTSFSLML